MTDAPNRPKVGDWVIFDDGFSEPRYEVQQVVRVTAQKVMTREKSYGERHHYDDRIKFFGDEVACHRLEARLTSSAGLAKDERRRAAERHRNRAAHLIAEARNK